MKCKFCGSPPKYYVLENKYKCSKCGAPGAIAKDVEDYLRKTCKRDEGMTEPQWQYKYYCAFQSMPESFQPYQPWYEKYRNYLQKREDDEDYFNYMVHSSFEALETLRRGH